MRTLGVKQVICTCGDVMQRTGGQFGGSITYDTYYCSKCHKAVNVVDLPKTEVADMEELMARKNA